jgi:hypothetical protein
MDEDAPQTSSADTPAGTDVMPSWHTNGSTSYGSSSVAPDGAGETSTPDDDAAFLSELAKAMKTAAGVERGRVAEDTDRRRADHIAAINARRDTEADRIRELAADDRKSIDAWADAERQRIQQEQARRTAALEEDLEKSLAEHRTRIDWEIERVEEAINSYRSEVETFFGSFETETDPVVIAQHAGRRPTFPALDALTVTAASHVDEASATVTEPEHDDSSGPGAPGASADATATAVAEDAVQAPPSAEASDSTEVVGDAQSEEPVAVNDATAFVASDDNDAPEAMETVDAFEPIEASAAVDGVEAVEATNETDPEPVSEPVTALATAPAEIDTSPETTGIGVMEPLSSTKLAEAWAVWNRSTAVADDAIEARRAAEQAEGDAEVEAQAEVSGLTPAGAYVEPVAAGAGADGRAGAPFSSGPGFARMSWLRREKDHNAG